MSTIGSVIPSSKLNQQWFHKPFCFAAILVKQVFLLDTLLPKKSSAFKCPFLKSLYSSLVSLNCYVKWGHVYNKVPISLVTKKSHWTFLKFHVSFKVIPSLFYQPDITLGWSIFLFELRLLVAPTTRNASAIVWNFHV
jgi:hypothetical protein